MDRPIRNLGTEIGCEGKVFAELTRSVSIFGNLLLDSCLALYWAQFQLERDDQLVRSSVIRIRAM
jgi:hypothetical protein